MDLITWQLYNYQLFTWEGERKFVILDGPPFASGRPHIGHFYNWVLKDISARYKMMKGYQVIFTPGFDCHGTSIENLSIGGGSVKLLSQAENLSSA